MLNRDLFDEKWDDESKYLDKYYPVTSERIREIYDPEVRDYFMRTKVLEYIISGDYTAILRPKKFEDIIKVDKEIYQQERDDFISLQKLNSLTTSDQDIVIFRDQWLHKRLGEIESDLTETYPDGKKKRITNSRKIALVEWRKYHDYLLVEIETIKGVNTSQPKPTPLQFPDLLINNFTKEDLDKLLIFLDVKNKDGINIWPTRKKSGLYGVIEALSDKGYLKVTNKSDSIKSLCNYVGLSQARAKEGYSTIQKKIHQRAVSFLNRITNK